jgi:hypothetical protein
VNTSGGAFTAGRRLAFSQYRVYVPLLRFDTSAIPDTATITSATLKVYVNTKVNQDSRNLVAEWYAASNWPIDTADYALDSTASALAPVDIGTIATSTFDAFALRNVGSVSTTGYTGLRLHVDGGAPAGDNYVQFAAFDSTTGTPKPQLVVTYTLP